MPPPSPVPPPTGIDRATSIITVCLIALCVVVPFVMSWKLIILIGLALIVTAGWLARREDRWLRSVPIVPGTVVELIPTQTRRSVNYRPRVRYTATDGSIRDFVRGYSSSPAGVSVNEAVAVGYDDAAHDVRIVTFGQRFGFAAFLAVLGLSLTLLGATFLVGRQFVPRIYAGNRSLTAPSQGW